MNSLAVLHLPKASGPRSSASTPSASEGWIPFETCQRILWIHPDGFLHANTDLEFHGNSDAYAFLLEVICGLRSRIFGETEILGQFKEFCRKNDSFFKLWGRALLEDAKLIRTRHMTGLGSKSYGSVLRRWTQDSSEIVLIGTGQLSRKLYPWFEGKNVRVLARSSQSPTRVGPWGLAGLWEDPSQRLSDAHAIIAAPIENAVLDQLSRSGAPKMWLDLRAERFGFSAQKTLEDLFKELERDQTDAEDRRSTIVSAIRDRAQARLDRLWCRPLGWEDLA